MKKWLAISLLLIGTVASAQVSAPSVVPWYSATAPTFCPKATPLYVIANGYTGAGNIYGNTSAGAGTSCSLLNTTGGGGVTSINSITGAFTFTGAGVSCTSTTCTFSGGGGVSSFSGDGTLLSNSASTGAVTATLANTGVGYGVWGNTGSSSGAPAYHALSSYPAAAFPTLNQNTTGNAGGLSSYPTACTGGQFSQGFTAGSNNCATPSGSGNVTGPGSSTANDFPVFSDTTGKLLGDSGKSASSFAAAPTNQVDESGSFTVAWGTSYRETGTGATVTLPAVSAPGSMAWVCTSSAGTVSAFAGTALNEGPTSLASKQCTTIQYDGTNLNGTFPASGGGLPSSTNGQTYYSSGTTGAATSAIWVGGLLAGSPVGVGTADPLNQFDIAGTRSLEVAFPSASVTFSASCSSSATSCSITGGANLPPTGGAVFIGLADGNNNQEYACYSAATSTTITWGQPNGSTNCPSNGRGAWGVAAQSHNNGEQLLLVEDVDVMGPTSVPALVLLQGGELCVSYCRADTSFGGNISGNSWAVTGGLLYAPSGVTLVSHQGQQSIQANSSNGQTYLTNSSGNAEFVGNGSATNRVITAQSVAEATLTAITTAVSPQMNNNATANGTLESDCTIIWSQATSGTVQFGVKASAAPTDLYVLEQDSAGAYSAPVYTTITSTTTTATSAALTPTAYGTVYASTLKLFLNPGTSNSISVALYASASANTLTIEPGTGCTSWF